MARFFTTHWQNRYWNSRVNSEWESARSSGSNLYLQRGVSPGDYVYIVSLSKGQLLLGGRIVVQDVVDRDTAVDLFDNDQLYDAADWLIGDESKGSRLNFHRQLSPEVTKRLRFLAPNGDVKEPFFVNDTDLDVQATRGVRELTSDSAALLEEIIVLTDQYPKSDEILVVGFDAVQTRLNNRAASDAILPNELPSNETFFEGTSVQVLVNRYERDPRAREACIRSHGPWCAICAFDFSEEYGPTFAGFIHVHHLVPLSEIKKGYVVDPVKDLIPICPNCHAAIHHRVPPYSVDEIADMMAEQMMNRQTIEEIAE